MTREATERLVDMLEAIEAIRSHVGGSLDRPDIASDVVLHAVLFNLIVIGEAAKHIDDELQTAAADVPWKDYAGLRDIIAHQYFRIQKRVVEDTVRRDLPPLEAAIKRLLA